MHYAKPSAKQLTKSGRIRPHTNIYPTDCISSQAAIDFASRDSNRIEGSIAALVAQRSPYADTIDGGTLSNDSETMRSVVEENGMPAASPLGPTFVPSAEICGTGGEVDQIGTTEFSYSLGKFRGRGPKICVETTRTAFKDSYESAVRQMKSNIKNVMDWDIRAQYLNYGGSKMAMDSTATFAQAFSGAINTIPGPGAGWPNRTVDSAPSFKAVEYAMTHMRETLDVQPWDDEGEGAFKLIAGQDVIQGFRDELDIREDTRALVTGRYAMGEKTITGYRFKGPYHAIAFGVDPKPLRATAVTAGVPTLVSHLTATNVTNGVAGRPNATWVAADYEVMFLIGQKSFQRQTPSYKKVAGWDFPQQFNNGELKFRILQDADCNLWGDFGLHTYQIARAYKPLFPHAVCAILFRRAVTDLNLVAV